MILKRLTYNFSTPAMKPKCINTLHIDSYAFVRTVIYNSYSIYDTYNIVY